jgi:hypothetical protein
MHRNGMFRQLELLKCGVGISKQDLKDWLLGEHAGRLLRLPGQQDVRVYFTHDESIFGPPFCDCFIECYFRDRGSLQKAFESTVMKSHFTELEKRSFRRENGLQITWAEENVVEIPGGARRIHTDKGKFCQMGTLRCAPGMTVDQLRTWWLEEHAETGKHLAGLKWYTILFPLRDAPCGPPGFDGYASVWYDSVQELKEAAGSRIMQGQMEDVRRHHMDQPELSKVVLADEHILRENRGGKGQP